MSRMPFTGKPLPWSSGRAFWSVLWMAGVVDPIGTFAGVGELVRGKRVRIWNRLCRQAAQHPGHYRSWRSNTMPKLESAWCGDAEPLAGIAGIVLETVDAEDSACTALSAAVGANAEIVALRADAKAGLLPLLDRLAAQGARWAVFIKAGDLPRRTLAAAISVAVTKSPAAEILYWDESAGQTADAAWIKPDWDPWLYLARDCLSGACALRIDAARQVLIRLPEMLASPQGVAELIMGMLASGVRPFHIPLVLIQRAGPASFSRPEDWPDMVERHWPKPVTILSPTVASPFLVAMPPAPKRWPTVSIIIPTKDRADLLETCLSSLKALRYEGEVEILVVDNGSRDAAALALMAKAQSTGMIKVIAAPGPFNFSALNNLAVMQSSGEVICLLNNDVEACDGSWLSTMVSHAADPRVGAVGAQLLYPDGLIQHAGVAIGMGDGAGHIQRGVNPQDQLHAGWHVATRQVSAVTAACLVVRRAAWDAVGGLDEAGFAVAFNDVDFCLKLQATGLMNIYCAKARLIHAESRTRPADNRPDQVKRFSRELALLQSRWHTAKAQDPHFSPLFSRTAEQCLLSLI